MTAFVRVVPDVYCGPVNSIQLRAALRLLTHWAPARALTLHEGELPYADERPWTESPDPADFAVLVPGRVPLAVEVLNHEVDDDDDERDVPTARPLAEVAAEVETLLLSRYPGDVTEPVRALLDQIACTFADGDLARLTVASEPGGPALDEVHLVSRSYGDALTLSLTAPETGTADHGPVETLTDIAEILGEYVWLTNNDRLGVTIKAEDHELPSLDDASVRTWWPTSEASAAMLVELWDEEPDMELVDDDALADFRASFAEDNMEAARCGAWASQLIDDYDVDDDPRPRFPGDRLVELFTGELLDRAAELAGIPRLAYGLGLEPGEYGLIAALVFAGPKRAVTLAISASA